MIERNKKSGIPRFEYDGDVVNITGESTPEDARDVWLVFIRQLRPFIEKRRKVKINFTLDIVNSATSLYFTEIFSMITYYSVKCKIKINWYHFEADEDMEFLGETYKERNPRLDFNLKVRPVC